MYLQDGGIFHREPEDSYERTAPICRGKVKSGVTHVLACSSTSIRLLEPATEASREKGNMVLYQVSSSPESLLAIVSFLFISFRFISHRGALHRQPRLINVLSGSSSIYEDAEPTAGQGERGGLEKGGG